mmetsp:Transcript_17232/g.29017  ORF Transcript_17232/g.29017 Transcript_17232/m.29017 type:complete len:316 (-) Transcript_17232:39-986(-)
MRQNSVELDEEDEEEQEYIQDIDGIMIFQHKILRKYAMLGMIHYSTMPFFHQLVKIRDYKMISIFEVFAQNRNEDDFLNNLEVLDDIRHQNEDQLRILDSRGDLNDEDGESGGIVSGGVDGNNSILNSQQYDSQRYNQKYQNKDFINQMSQALPQINQQLGQQFERQVQNQSVQQTNQAQRLQNNQSSRQLASNTEAQSVSLFGGNKQSQQAQGFVNIASTSTVNKNTSVDQSSVGIQPQSTKTPAPTEDQSSADPNIAVLDSVKDKMSSDEYHWVVKKIGDQDKRILTTFKCFKMTKDAADLVNSLQRLYAKQK